MSESTQPTRFVTDPALPMAPRREEDVQTAIAAALTALGIAKEVGELLKHIPYVKGVAGALLEIIKIQDEIKINKDRCAELVKIARNHTATLLHLLWKLSQAPQRDQLKELEADLLRYKGLLESTVDKLLACTLGNWRSSIDRSKVLHDLQRCERELNSFHQDFTMTRLSSIEQGVQQQAVTIQRHDALNHLLFTPGASWLSHSGCLEGTRNDLLSLIQAWIEASSGDSPKIFCLTGAAGAGKSAIAHSVAERAKHLIASTFFVTRRSPERCSLSRILGTLIWELAEQSQRFGDAVGEAINRQRALASADPARQFVDLLLPSIPYLDQSRPLLWIIDALDELEDPHAFVDFLCHHVPKLPGNFRILITYRRHPVFNIFDSLQHLESAEIPLQSQSSKQDIDLIARTQLQRVALVKQLTDWPRDDVIEQFIKKAEGLPIWVTIVAAFLRKSSAPKLVLNRLLTQSRFPSSPDSEVDSLYTTVLESSGNWDEASFILSLPLVLGTLLIIQRPLSIETLQSIYSKHDKLQEMLPNIIQGLSPFLTTVVPSHTKPLPPYRFSTSDPLGFIHLTVRDFLVGPSQSMVKISLPECHDELALRCLQVLNLGLANDMPGVGWLNDEGTEGIPTLQNTDIPEVLRYSSEFWIHHLTSGTTMSRDILVELECFLSGKLLLWTEFQTCTSEFQACIPLDDLLVTNSGQHAACRPLHNLLNRHDFAMGLLRLSKRLGFMNRLEEALNAGEHAVNICRSLSAEFNPDFAKSLNYLSVSLSKLGRREEALSVVEEATTICRLLVSERSAAFNPALAVSLNNLAARLSELGRREEALTAIDEVVKIYRLLASERPAEFNPELAMSLDIFSKCLSDLGHHEEALTAIDEAVKIHRLLASERPAEFNPALAMSLDIFSRCLSNFGRHEEALTTTDEAVTIRRLLASERSAAFIPHLAVSLHNRSKCLSDLGRHEEALTAIDEAVKISRLLASERPAEFNPGLAMSLDIFSNCLSNVGHHEEALTAIDEAVTILRLFASERPAAFNSDLAKALHYRSKRLQVPDLGRHEEALIALEEAVNIHRLLASERPMAFNPYLSVSLDGLATYLSELGRREEALSAIDEAVKISRLLASERPAVLNPGLAISLHNRSKHLSDLGRHEEALTANDEAVKIHRLLASERPAVFNPFLAMSLDMFSICLSNVGRHEEAVTAIDEAVTIRRLLASERPAAFNSDLAKALHYRSKRLRVPDLARHNEALIAFEEALKIHRLLASERPMAFNPDLALALDDLACYLSELGCREEALSAIDEAVKISRLLAPERPAVFNPGLATSLRNRSKHLSDLGRHEEALTAIDEAVKIHRLLASERPAVFNPFLAMSLDMFSICLSNVGRHEEAVTASEQASKLRRT